MKNITKIFPGVVALNKVNFNLLPGEVHVLVGENGAGKSTLIKCIAGAYQPDEGEIYFKGKKILITSPKKAQELGIATIYQEFNLIPELTLGQNIFLGREPKKLNNLLIDWKNLYKKAKELIESLGIELDPRLLVSEASISQQQMIEIAKALSMDAKIILFDEPTSALAAKDIEILFKIIKKLREKKIGIIYISHRLEEIKEIGDRVTTFRDGEYIDTFDANKLAMDKLIYSMIGREIKDQFPRTYNKPNEELLRVEKLTRKGLFKNISFNVRSGEIVGFAGLIGSGRTEVMNAIFGSDKIDSGRVFIEGREIKPTPRKCVSLSMGFIPEDRKDNGICLKLSVKENIIHAAMSNLFKNGIINVKKEEEYANQYIEKLRIKTPSLYKQVRYLSGGNQQKVVLAKWLLTKAKIFIFDEPTRGIDVGAKSEFHKLMDVLVAEGAALIMISSEMPEILGMSDRVYVMNEGRITTELSREEASQEKILSYAMGIKVS
ncbi:MAG: sugar ABC transporter ATP-binding protein [Candidatus Atribacteria bacterium]|nr:sugar ABC transporter ATP-binding protein [Candidatus Atribacteria bacterium]